MDEVKKRAETLYGAQMVFTQPASIPGLGGSSGVGFNFCSLAGCTPEQLLEAVDDFTARLREDPKVKSVVHGFTCSTPQLELKLDRMKAEMLGVTPKVVFSTLQNKLASYYVNDFNIKGGVYQVKLQNDPDYRGGIEDILAIRIPTSKGDAVPLSSIGKLEYVGGTRETMSYNKMLAAWVDVTPNPGVSSSEIMKLIESTPRSKDFVIEWGPVALQELENEGQVVWFVLASIVFAYLFLVAQYESWTIPLPVMLSVTFALAGAIFGIKLTSTVLSVYAQLGCIMLIALSAKNAILMVEFSKQERAAGVDIAEAAMNGAKLRYRAVLMTAWSFIMGVLPLVLAKGAGAESMKAIGITTFSGMLFATVVGIVFVPALYALFQRMRERVTHEGKGRK
jgi:multidrug efflux pump subunit AcrB